MVVHPYSHGDSSCPAVLWIQLASIWFRIPDSHRLWLAFPDHSAIAKTTCRCPNPVNIATYGLASSAFARHYSRNLGWFLFLALLRCFSSDRFPHTTMYSSYDDQTWLWSDCSIRKSTDRCPLTAPRGLSQLVASFFGSQCQGIPLALFVAWPCVLFLDLSNQKLLFTEFRFLIFLP